MINGYYNYLKTRIAEEPEAFKCITYLPEIFKTLAAILESETIVQEDRVRINAAVAYIVVPTDVIPEEVYGSWGYFDDLFIGSLILSEMHEKYPQEVKNAWAINEDLNEIMNYCVSQSKKFLEEKNLTNKVLEYAGLR